MSPSDTAAFDSLGPVRVEVERRVLRFWRPLDTAQGPLRARAIFLVTLRAPDGAVGVGEAAPLLAFGTESEAACAGALAELESPAVPIELGDELSPPNRWTTPAAAAAVELACLDLRARREGRALAASNALVAGAIRNDVAVNALIGGASPDDVAVNALIGGATPDDVAVNALIGGATPDEVHASALVAAAAGFATLKLKVALPAERPEVGLALDVARIEAARAAAPGLRLRLDANGGWPDPDVALAALESFARFSIELLEQPLSAPQISRAAQGSALGSRSAAPTWARRAAILAELRRRSPIPLAADESVLDDLSARALLNAGAVDFLVLKPMRLGGLLPAFAIAQEARERGVTCFVTGFLGGAVERAGALHLALALDGMHGPGPSPAHGLAAGGWLVEDVAAGPAPRQGRMAPLPGPGHGVVVGGDR